MASAREAAEAELTPAPVAAAPQAAALAPAPAKVLELQRTAGNRAVGRLLAGRRQVARTGWTGVDAHSMNATARDVHSTGPHTGARRIPIEGIAEGHADSDLTELAPNETTHRAHEGFPVSHYTHETPGTGTAGRAIVIIPKLLPPVTEVKVLFHLHGHNLGYRARGARGTPRDEAVDHIAEQVVAAQQPLIAILPQGGFYAFFGRNHKKVNVDTYIQQVFRLIPASEWPIPPPQPGGVILSGHSGAGAAISEMLAHGGAPARLERLIGFDTINSSGPAGTHGTQYTYLRNFLISHLDSDLATLQNMATPAPTSPQVPVAQVAWLRQNGFRYRGVHTGGAHDQGYGQRYAELQQELDQWFAQHAADLGGTSSDVYRALHDNYSIVSGGQNHDRMIGANDHLQAALAP